MDGDRLRAEVGRDLLEVMAAARVGGQPRVDDVGRQPGTDEPDVAAPLAREAVRRVAGEHPGVGSGAAGDGGVEAGVPGQSLEERRLGLAAARVAEDEDLGPGFEPGDQVELDRPIGRGGRSRPAPVRRSEPECDGQGSCDRSPTMQGLPSELEVDERMRAGRMVMIASRGPDPGGHAPTRARNKLELPLVRRTIRDHDQGGEQQGVP